MQIGTILRRRKLQNVPTETSRIRWAREELLHLLSLSGTLAGLSITSITLFRTFSDTKGASTIADDLLALCALLFLVCCYVIFWALRVRSETLLLRLTHVSDILFLAGLTAMVIVGFLMLYSIL